MLCFPKRRSSSSTRFPRLGVIPSSFRQAVLWFLAPALLLGVAGWHSYQVAANDLTAWEGGGFGMFSTVDKRQVRFVRCELITATGAVRARLPGHLDTYVEQLRALPTQERADELAEYLDRAAWAPPSDSGGTSEGDNLYRYVAPGDTSSAAPVPVAAVRVEVWRYRFHSRPFRLEASRLVTATAPGAR